jgi:hypothetical protein
LNWFPLATLALLVGCQAQPVEPAPRGHALPKHHVHLSAEGVVRGGEQGGVLSLPTTLRAEKTKILHVHCDPKTTYRTFLMHVLAPAIEAESKALVLYSEEGDGGIRLDMVVVPDSHHVSFATLVLGPNGLSFEGTPFRDEDTGITAIRDTREGWRGSGTLAVQLDIPRTNEGLLLPALQRAAALVRKADCAPALISGDCAYAIERHRFEHAMSAKETGERLRRLTAHVKAYPKAPGVSTRYLPFAWEWKGEIYVGNEWTEWHHVRSGRTLDPLIPHPGGESEAGD